MSFQAYLSPDNDLKLYSSGTAAIMADRQIKRGIAQGTVELSEPVMGTTQSIVTYKPNGKWFVLSGEWGNDKVFTAMMGAACGDVAGSVYEWHNIKYKPDPDRLIRHHARFTDDTVMTCAVAEGLHNGLVLLPADWIHTPDTEQILFDSVQRSLVRFGLKYPDAGYGGSFRRWLRSDHRKPYGSWGNGSAMRASYAGWVARSLEEAEKLAEISAKVTHNHPRGIQGAVVVAGCIYLLRNQASKQDIREYAGKFYNLDFTLDQIRESYTFDVSCAGSVPQAIAAFLEGSSFADIIANAISIGGDSDTIAAIAGSIAEVIYPIPQGFRGRVIDRMDDFLLTTIAEAVDFAAARQPE